MLALAQALSFLDSPLVYAFLCLCSFYFVLSKFWWTTAAGEGKRSTNNRAATSLNIYAQSGSKYASHVVENCSTLQTGYQPPFLWGTSGHLQALYFGIIGRSVIPEVKGHRHTVVAVDGSTLHYDVYDPKKEREVDSVSGEERSPYTFFVCPGINNSSESSYVKTFTSYITEAGYRVIVYNHLGALKSEKLTGPRIFTYAGTEDMALVFKDICKRFPHTKLIGCGFSLGAVILIRFLGEKKERRDKFICATSCCQGYDPSIHINLLNDWTNLRRLYSYVISKRQKKLISHHKNTLLPQKSNQQVSSSCGEEMNGTKDDPRDNAQDQLFSGFPTDVIHGQYNSNGFCLDRKKLNSLAIDEERLWASTSMLELDDCYTRHVLGFETVEEMYKWMSCTELMNEIDDFPLLFLNALDDPCVAEVAHAIPRNYAESHSKSIFVQTQHGSHVGFYEGGLSPNWVTWMDRLILEFSEACISAGQNP